MPRRKRFTEPAETTQPTPSPLRDQPCFEFPLVRGIQAGKEYYCGMIPLRLLKKLFVFDDEEVPAELRAQRSLNLKRAREITEYVLDNKMNYVFNSLTVMIDVENDLIEFEPIAANSDLGTLRVSVDAKFLISDGQHRTTGLIKAVEEERELADETISVVFFLWSGVKRAQQIFHDLNDNISKPTKSLNILYDHRNEQAGMTRSILEAIPLFKRLTDTERISLGKTSLKLFTLNGIDEATSILLRGNSLSYEEKMKLVIAYWIEVCKHMSDWQAALNRKVAAAEIRQTMIHAHAITLVAFGYLGNTLLQQDNWQSKLIVLEQIDWNRDNPDWQNVIIFGDRIHKSRGVAQALANYIADRIDPLNQPASAEAIEELKEALSALPEKTLSRSA